MNPGARRCRFCTLLPAGLLLAGLLLAGLAGCAAGGEPESAQPRASVEAGTLQRYVLLVCIGASYDRLPAPPEPVLRLLRDEAWVFVEQGSSGPETYETLHRMATAAGQAIPPQAAVRACLDWSARPEVRGRIRQEAERSRPGPSQGAPASESLPRAE